MTKEELEKEAEEWLKSNIKTENREGITFNIVPTPVQIYCAGAEPREKQIADLEAQLEREKNLNQCLSDHNEQLRELIEKMKCCPTCDNNKEEHTPEEHYRCKTCKKFCNWDLAD